MPPRSATRKKSTPASAKAKKSTLKSKQSVVESTPVDQKKNVELAIKGEELEATTEDSSCNNQREGVSAAVNDGEGEREVTGVGKINPGFVDANPGFGPKVKEGAVEEERDVKGVKGDQIKVTVESFVEGGERVESVEREGGHEKNDNVYAAEGTEKSDNAAEGEQIEGRDGDYGGVQLAIIPEKACKCRTGLDWTIAHTGRELNLETHG